jgi:hypothetical protein
MIVRIELDAEIAAFEYLRCQQGRARSAEWIEHEIACLGEGLDQRLERRNGPLYRMQLIAGEYGMSKTSRIECCVALHQRCGMCSHRRMVSRSTPSILDPLRPKGSLAAMQSSPKDTVEAAQNFRDEIGVKLKASKKRDIQQRIDKWVESHPKAR